MQLILAICRQKYIIFVTSVNDPIAVTLLVQIQGHKNIEIFLLSSYIFPYYPYKNRPR